MYYKECRMRSLVVRTLCDSICGIMGTDGPEDWKRPKGADKSEEVPAFSRQMSPRARVMVAANLDQLVSGMERRTHDLARPLTTKLHNLLSTAIVVQEKDEGANKAIDTAIDEMLRLGMITKEELDELIAEAQKILG